MEGGWNGDLCKRERSEISTSAELQCMQLLSPDALDRLNSAREHKMHLVNGKTVCNFSLAFELNIYICRHMIVILHGRQD